jgi:hypothetical protein
VWIALLVSTACVSPRQQLGPDNPYARLVGTEYRIVGDVDAFGIYARSEKKLDFIDLIPGVGIAGREVAFRRRVPHGQIVRILSAWQQPQFLDVKVVYFLVALDGSELPRDIPVELALARGNEGVGADLNAEIYERIKK